MPLYFTKLSTQVGCPVFWLTLSLRFDLNICLKTLLPLVTNSVMSRALIRNLRWCFPSFFINVCVNETCDIFKLIYWLCRFLQQPPGLICKQLELELDSCRLGPISFDHCFVAQQIQWDNCKGKFSAYFCILISLLISLPVDSQIVRKSCGLPTVLFSHPDSILPHSPSVPNKKYISGLILGLARQIESNILLTPPIILQRQKLQHFSLNFDFNHL